MTSDEGCIKQRGRSAFDANVRRIGYWSPLAGQVATLMRGRGRTSAQIRLSAIGNTALSSELEIQFS